MHSSVYFVHLTYGDMDVRMEGTCPPPPPPQEKLSIYKSSYSFSGGATATSVKCGIHAIIDVLSIIQ